MKWVKTKYPGVRYREHATRKHGVMKDRYYTIYYKVKGTLHEEGIGWASEGRTAEDASLKRGELRAAHKTGQGAASLAEGRAIDEERREKVKAEQTRLEKENITFGQYFLQTYLPPEEEGNNKKKHKNKELRSFTDEQRKYITEEQLFRLWLEPQIGSIPFKDISDFHLRKIKKAMLDAKKSARTIQYAFAVVRQAWNMARRDKFTAGVCPTIHVKAPKIDNRRLRFLSPSEAETLLAALKDKSEQLHNMALLSLKTGMRAGELFSLQWGHVDFARSFINIVDTKSGRNRAAYLTGEIKAMLHNLYGKGKEHGAFVFTSRSGGRIKEISSAFDKVVKKLKFNNGIADPRQKVVFHTLRHTFASWLVENRTDLYTVKELMGHSTLAMTERYSHLGANTLQSAVKSLEKSLLEKTAAQKAQNKTTG